MKLRDYEDHLKSMQDIVKNNRVRNEYVVWEKKTDGKIKRNRVMQRYQGLQQQREDSIDERRQRLAQKLRAEDEALMQELQSNVHSADHRRKKLADKARKLAEQKEERRQAVADELLERQWREGCDPLRALDSHRRLMQVVDTRRAQVYEKAEAHERELEYDRNMQQKADEMNDRYDAWRASLEKAQREKDDEAAQMIQLQIQDVRKREVELEQQRQQEISEMKAIWAGQDQAAADAVKAQFEKNKKLGEDMKLFNKLKQSEVRAIEMREQEEDEAMVQDQLRQAREEEEREQERKAIAKEEQRMYREHLKLLMQKEAVDDTERNRLIDEAAAVQQMKQDARWQKEADARANLMMEVQQSREQQISGKQHKKQMRKDEDQADYRKMLKEVEQIDLLEAQNKSKLRAARLQTRFDIQAQIRRKEEEEEFRKELKRREAVAAEQAEAAYQGKISALMKEAEPQQYFPRKSAKWFT